jgi:hypothetical protein
MLSMRFRSAIFFLFCLTIWSSCKKEPSETFYDNEAPYYDKIPSVKIRNYVNRLFIDLIGREPLDAEMTTETNLLLASNADQASRVALVNKLMRDSTFREGDTSYTHAYFGRLYELNKIRFIEGQSEAQLSMHASIFRNNAISDSLGNNFPGYEQNMVLYRAMVDVIESSWKLRQGIIDIQKVYEIMLLNDIYDIINMNSFNFVNAAFNDLFFRFPTQSEFYTAYGMVEDNTSGSLFGATGQTKADFVRIIANSTECLQGAVIWSYQTLLARNPTSQEMNNELLKFGVDKDFQAMQMRIVVSNEYTNF